MTKNHYHPTAPLHEVHVRIRSSKGLELTEIVSVQACSHVEAYELARKVVDLRVARRNAGKVSTRWSRI